ncbi:MocR-like pyridoxine biosynthesis transcription factor PdxR [Neorhizobium alkalisoli]|uniref:MocR-like pyridoxine biosynthesis transcription factor PdxR n=1 Tax=Neorhizobium alkalisoli TaxID=528178 RepID=UPI000CFA2317|nr:PLP-dependent aminotransferase family protein [Neorhizobium alkalisoli]
MRHATHTSASARGIYLGLRDQIVSGVYAPGDRLPSTRALAEELGVSRTTVTTAFDQLISEGYVTVRQGAKATVADNVAISSTDQEPRIGNVYQRLSGYAKRAMELPSHLPGSGNLRYDFRYGDVAPDDFPRLAWRKALTTAVLARRERLGYGHPAGSLHLRQALQGYLWRARGIRCDAEQIVVVNGSQQAVDLCARVLVDPGDRVLVEEPCYAMARYVFLTVGAEPVPMRCDSEGMDTACLPEPGRHTLAFVTPSHQFPLGGVLSVGRRRQLVEWAEAGNAYVIEDDYDGEYRYDVRPIPPLYISGKGRVVYIGTVSKTLSPTLRLGYLVLPKSLVEPFVRCKQIADRHGATFEQEALASLIESGIYERHVRKMRRMNSERRAAFLGAMLEVFGDRVEIVGTSAGLHVVVWFNGFRGEDENEFARKALAAGVGIYPISRSFSQQAERRAGFVFGYASMPVQGIAEGVRLLAAVLPPC